MNRYKNKKRVSRNRKLEKEITTYLDLENKIYYLESLKLCTQSREYKKQIDNNIKNIIEWWNETHSDNKYMEGIK